MKAILSAGTDVASVSLFDPAALDDSFDRQIEADPQAAIETMGDAGRVIEFQTGGDGDYLFHLYLDEPMPASFEKYAKDPISVDTFAIPSGTVWAVGTEYVSHDPKTALGRATHMGSRAEVPPGEYEVTLYRTDWPERLIEREVRKRTGKPGRLESTLETIGGACFPAAFFSFALFPLGLRRWLMYGLPLALSLLFVIPFIIFNLPIMKRAQKIRAEVEREYPSVVVEMRRKGRR